MLLRLVRQTAEAQLTCNRLYNELMLHQGFSDITLYPFFRIVFPPTFISQSYFKSLTFKNYLFPCK